MFGNWLTNIGLGTAVVVGLISALVGGRSAYNKNTMDAQERTIAALNGQIDALNQQNDQLKEQNTSLIEERAVSAARITDLERQMAELRDTITQRPAVEKLAADTAAQHKEVVQQLGNIAALLDKPRRKKAA